MVVDKVRQRKGPDHVVQFYGANEEPLARNAGAFLAYGFQRGQRLLIVASEERAARIVAALRACDVPVDDRTVTVLDADRTLKSFLDRGFPDRDKFLRAIGATIHALLDGGRGVSAYGEMVGILWTAKKYPAAVRLEQLWNALLEDLPVRLFCGYPIDVFGGEFRPSMVGALLCAHSELISSHGSRSLEDALERAIAEVVGAQRWEDAGRRLGGGYADFPKLEATILRLRSALPQYAAEVLERTKGYYADVS